MDPLAWVLLWRIPFPSAWHGGSLAAFLPTAYVLWRARDARRGRVYGVLQVAFRIGYLAAICELLYNAYFELAWGSVDPLAVFRGDIWLLIGSLLVAGTVYDGSRMLSRESWRVLLLVEATYFGAWLGFGFPVSINVVPGAPSHPLSLLVNAAEIGQYVVWNGLFVLLKKRPGEADVR